MATTTLRKNLQRLIPFVVSIAALFAVFASVDTDALLDAMSWRIVMILFPAMLLYGLVTLALEVICIVRIVNGSGQQVDPLTVARIKAASYLVMILHYALGVGAMTLLLRRRAGLTLSQAASAVVLVSTSDLVVVLALASASAAMVGFDFPVAGVFGLAIGGFVGGLSLLRAPFDLGPLERLRALPFFAALRAVPLPRLAELIGYRIVFSCTFLAVSAAAFLSFDLMPDLPTLVVGMMAVAVVSALPIAISGLGTGQAAFLYVFKGVSDPGTLLAVSLALSAAMIVLRVSTGLLFAREFTREVLEEPH